MQLYVDDKDDGMIYHHYQFIIFNLTHFKGAKLLPPSKGIDRRYK